MSKNSKQPTKATIAAQENLQEMVHHYVPEALRAIVGVMRDPKASPTVRLSAATTLLDRAHGTPSRAFVVRESVPSPEAKEASEFMEMISSERDKFINQTKVLAHRLSQELGCPMDPEASYVSVEKHLREMGILDGPGVFEKD